MQKVVQMENRFRSPKFTLEIPKDSRQVPVVFMVCSEQTESEKWKHNLELKLDAHSKVWFRECPRQYDKRLKAQYWKWYFLFINTSHWWAFY